MKTTAQVIALPGAAAESARQQQANIEAQLRDTVTEIDGYAQSGFSQIQALAKLALVSMELPASHHSSDAIAHILDVIAGIAMDFENCINCSAENVGCNYVDEAQRRRRAAQRVVSQAPAFESVPSTDGGA